MADIYLLLCVLMQTCSNPHTFEELPGSTDLAEQVLRTGRHPEINAPTWWVWKSQGLERGVQNRVAQSRGPVYSFWFRVMPPKLITSLGHSSKAI